MEQLLQSIFSFEGNDTSCVFAAFAMMREYNSRTWQVPNSSVGMFNEIESLLIYFLQLAEENNIDMDKVINLTSPSGQSFFHLATMFSENISLELLKRNVKVNRINSEFMTPHFRVR